MPSAGSQTWKPGQLSGVRAAAAMPINQFTQQSNFMLAALAGAERIFELMEEPPNRMKEKSGLVHVNQTEKGLEKTEKRTGRWAWENPKDGSLTLLKGDVRFHGVTFGYLPEKDILKEISLYASRDRKSPS